MLNNVLQTDADLSSKFPGSRSQNRSSDYASSTNETEVDASDDASVVTAKGLDQSKNVVSDHQGHPVYGLDAEIEHGLLSSTVYLRAEKNHSSSSLPLVSDSGSKCGWSLCSNFSLAQISSITVVSLPISSWELWKPGQYVVPKEKNIENSRGRLRHSSLDGRLIAPTVAHRTQKSPNRPPSARTVPYEIILDQTLMNFQTFAEFRQTHDITEEELVGALESNIWVNDFFWEKRNSRDQNLNEKVILFG